MEEKRIISKGQNNVTISGTVTFKAKSSIYFTYLQNGVVK